MDARRSSATRPFSGKSRNGVENDQQGDDASNGSSCLPKKRSIVSPDSVRKKILAEGRSARNLVTWSVPLTKEEANSKPKRRGKLKGHYEGRSLDGKKGVVVATQLGGEMTGKEGVVNERAKNPNATYNGPADAVKRTVGGGDGNEEGIRSRRDLKARYWSYLFDNLQRAVDEIYATCEMDVSVVECQEVIMTLDVCTRDFRALIDRIKLQEAFEKADEASRPTSLAWEVRKTSPGRRFSAHPQDRNPPSQNMHQTAKQQATNGMKTSQKQAVISWADRVKGIKPAETKYEPDCVKTADENATDRMSEVPVVMKIPKIAVVVESDEMQTDGWETVRRSRPGRGARRRLDNEEQFKVEKPRDRMNKEGEKHSQMKLAKAETSDITPKDRSDDVMSCTDDITDHHLKTVSTENPNDDVTHETDDVMTQSTSDNVNTPDNDVIDQHNIQGLTVSSDDPLDQSRLSPSNVPVKVESVGLSSGEDEELLALPLSDDERPPDHCLKAGDELAASLSDLGDESEMSFSLGSSTKTLDWQDIMAVFDADASLRESTSWADRCESPPETRSPGRAIHLHQKLSSPSRRRSADEHKKMIEEKQVKAQLQRDRLQEEKAEKLRIHTKKVQEVREIKDEQLRQKRVNMEQKLLRAEQLRSSVLQERIRKAQEEEIKVSEIAFINSLEAQNKKMEMQEKHQGQETRLQNIEEERQRKREEQQAKEDAAQERKRALEAERMARLEGIKQKKKEQDVKIEQMRLERERVREETAKEKARERERRLEAQFAAHQLSLKEKKKKIEMRRNETMKRYDQQLEQKKAKAACHSRHGSEDACVLANEAFRMVPTPDISHSVSPSLLRKCSSPNSSIGSGRCTSGSSLDVEVGEVGGHQRTLSTVEESHSLQERLRGLKKRSKKLRQRMSAKANSYESALASAKSFAPSDSANKIRIQKAVKEIGKLLRSQMGAGIWPDTSLASLDKAITILRHSLDQKSAGDQDAFRTCGGFPTLFGVLLLVDTSNRGSDQQPKAKSVLPLKSFSNTCHVMTLACHHCVESCQYLLLSNKLGSVVDLLTSRLTAIQEDYFSNALPSDSLASSLMDLLISAMASVLSPRAEEFVQSQTDLVSYLVCQGVVERLHLLLVKIQKPIVGQEDVQEFVKSSLHLMVVSTETIHTRGSPFSGKVQDSTQLPGAFNFTNLLGILPLLYALLLHNGAPRYSSGSPPKLVQSTIDITTWGFRLLNRISQLDLRTVQTCIGTEGNGLEFQHVTGYILWYCSKHKCEVLLHEAIEIVGYFSVNNPSGQAFLQSGRSPTLLQLLCCLPFHYFSDPRLIRILFPTLIAACYECPANKLILEQEMSCVLLATFIEEQLLFRSSTASNTTMTAESTAEWVASDWFASRFPVSEWEKAIAFFRQ